ncbi:MAG: LCCL domain-containing protein [Tepidisphaerales bacterium]
MILAHLKRRDHWVGWLELLAGCVWWWNPLYWYVRHQLRENAELACDAWVVGTLPRGRRAYAEALLAVCESMSRPAAPMPALGVGTGGRRFLRRRLTMIIQEHVPFRLPRTGLLVAALLTILNVPAWSQKAPDDPAAPWQQRVRVEQDRALAERTETALPDAAREVVERFERQSAEAREQFEKESQRQRARTIERLETLADTYAANGLVREAAAVRNVIKRIQAEGRTAELFGPAGGVLPDPGNLAGFRDRAGQTFSFRVTGSVDGMVWGSDLYTDDSSVATAAVHAGLVKPGEQAVVKVRIVEGAQSYEATTRNGVTTNPYLQWFGSFRFESGPAGGDARVTPLPPDGTIQKFRGQDNQVLLFEVTGSTLGTIWGDEMYTDDSPLAVAAVHAGVLRDGEKGIVAVTIRPARDSYGGSARNGVTSRAYGGFLGSYRVSKAVVAAAAAELDPAPALGSLRGEIGRVLFISLTGSTTESVWGTDVYTDDSSPAAAAVHAGVLKDGERGIVKITIAARQETYTGSTRNGVDTRNWGDWGGSFRVERVPEGFTPPKVYQWSAPAPGNLRILQLEGVEDVFRRR